MNLQVMMEGAYEYDLKLDPTADDETLILSRSNSSDWVYPGECIGSLIDDGDGLIVKGMFNKPLKLDYSQAFELMVLLLARNDAAFSFNQTEEVISVKPL